MTDTEPLLTQKDLAKKLGLPLRTVRYLSETGRIPLVRFSPRVVRYVYSKVWEAIEQKITTGGR
jgi:hypothetical protein